MTHSFDSSPIPFATLPEAVEHWARTTPHAPALGDAEHELTYAQLSEAVGRYRTWLGQHGAGSGDAVVLVGHNTVPWVLAYLAVLSIGGVIAPANNRLSPQQLADQTQLLEARLVLHDEAHVDMTGLVGTAPVVPLPELLLDVPVSPFSAPGPDSAALVSFTSGTTGRPKGAVLSQRALAEASWAFVRVMATDSTASTLVLVPMFHNTGFIDQLGHMLLVGGRTDLLLRFSTSAAVARMTTKPVTYLAAVPSIHRLLMLADGADEALASVQLLLYGGSPMPHAWITEYLERWPGMQLFHGYGLTEYGSAISFLPPTYAETHGESVGFAVPETAIRIVDEDLRDCPPGTVGELWCQGPTMMMGYWNQPELTAAKIHEGWLRTGDLARLEDGLYYIEGRVDDVINRGGEKILPAHVEGLLARIDGVAQACVFPVPDPILQNRVYAVVELRPGGSFDEAAARDGLRLQLPDYAVPEGIAVHESLPRTASGKIDRRAVASAFTAP
jgi:acyl-CoA synthetase (AMP-forming)/AMP-acid ligase II